MNIFTRTTTAFKAGYKGFKEGYNEGKIERLEAELAVIKPRPNDELAEVMNNSKEDKEPMDIKGFAINTTAKVVATAATTTVIMATSVNALSLVCAAGLFVSLNYAIDTVMEYKPSTTESIAQSAIVAAASFGITTLVAAPAAAVLVATAVTPEIQQQAEAIFAYREVVGTPITMAEAIDYANPLPTIRETLSSSWLVVLSVVSSLVETFINNDSFEDTIDVDSILTPNKAIPADLRKYTLQHRC